jgi:2,4-dienoyl-CoA reductase-like NADH-dependent reductase (Old Yellow Enzyme family)
LESLKALIGVFGADRVGIKLSPAGGYNDVGMPIQETLDTFTYLITEIDKLKIAYIALVRYSEAFDAPIDGKHRGTPHDVLESYGHLIKNSKRFLNLGLTPDEGASLIDAGKIDAAIFGMPWISHPDYARRIQEGKPLDGVPDFAHLYGSGKSADEERKGYTDYPFAT